MKRDRFRVITPTGDTDYRDLVRGLTKIVWPEFMRHDQVANELWHELLDRFADYQLALYDIQNQRVAAMGNSFPLRWDDSLENLPEGGWDWAFSEAVRNHREGISPNVHCAIQIIIHPDYQGQRLSAPIIEAVRGITVSNRLPALIIPLRPSEKSKYPLISLDDYVTWTNEAGLPLDPWLRAHARLGARVVKACHESKIIRGTRTEWEAWTQMKFPQSGRYVIPGALVPIVLNVEKDEGVYVEPNVWIAHAAL